MRPSRSAKTPPIPAKDLVAIVQGMLTIAAILAGGWWFFEQRLDKPQIRLETSVTQRPLSSDSHKWLIAIQVRATNTGKTNVLLPKGSLVIAQIDPVSSSEAPIDTEVLDELNLEPGETDQSLLRTFILSETYKTILVQSQYLVPRPWYASRSGDRKDYAWKLESIVDIGKPSTKTSDFIGSVF